MEKSISQQVEQIIGEIDPISLDEMDHVKLMRRRDTKFVLPAEKVAALIGNVISKYRVLEIDGQRTHDYHTLYYDTPLFDMYLNHHNRRLNRYKVRVRQYLSSNISFLEVKFKNNKRETIKKRIRPEQSNGINGEKSELFLNENSPYTADEIHPSLQNNFSRITLVHRTIPERITIDINLTFSDVNGNKTFSLPNLSVIEVKRERDAVRSDIINLLRKNNIRPMGFSKYCMGTALINRDIKSNLFKTRMRRIGKYEKRFLSA